MSFGCEEGEQEGGSRCGSLSLDVLGSHISCCALTSASNAIKDFSELTRRRASSPLLFRPTAVTDRVELLLLRDVKPWLCLRTPSCGLGAGASWESLLRLLCHFFRTCSLRTAPPTFRSATVAPELRKARSRETERRAVWLGFVRPSKFCWATARLPSASTLLRSSSPLDGSPTTLLPTGVA